MGQHLRQTAFEFHAVRDTAPLLQTNPHQHCALHYAQMSRGLRLKPQIDLGGGKAFWRLYLTMSRV